MCDPISIIGAALSVGSAVMNYSAQSKVDSARSNVMAAERIRQQGLDQEATAYNERSRNRYEGFEDQQDTKSKTLGEMFKEPGVGHNGGPPLEEQSIAPSDSGIVTSEVAKKSGQAKAYTDNQADKLGELRAFGDLLGGVSRDQARDAGYVGQIGGFKRGSSNIVPFELEEANNAGNSMRFLGDIMGGLGKVGVSAGLGGGSMGKLFGGAPAAGGNSVGSFNTFPTQAAPVSFLASPSNPFRWS